MATIQELKQEREQIVKGFNAYHDPVARKEFHRKLRENEAKLVQHIDIKVGQIFYESWGYDQTQNDFCEIVEVSPTKKTVLCRMIGKKTATVDAPTYSTVEPNKDYLGPTLFRLKVAQYDGGATLRGSYPFVDSSFPMCKLYNRQRPQDHKCTTHDFGESVGPYDRWSGDRREHYCKGCTNYYREPNVSYREGSFSVYTKPVYETPFGFGH